MQISLLAVVLMVKNEEHAIVKTLLPFIKSGVKDFLIFDTGSEDGTVEVTKSFFAEHNLNGFVDQEKFIDFATSRNRSLVLAEQYFPETKFFAVIDADWYIHGADKLLEYCDENKDDNYPVYMIRLLAGNTEIAIPRLFRAASKNRFRGVVHEEPEDKARDILPAEIYFECSQDRAHLRKSRARYQSDVNLLLKDYKKHPTNPRTLFYIGQTYECLGEQKNAYKYYVKRSAFKVHPEEDHITFFRLGYLAEHLSLVENKITWETAYEYYLKSYSVHACRVEPVLAIASHYLKEFPQYSYILLNHACRMPYPEDDCMFIQKHMYQYTRYELLSACAHSVYEYEVGKEATLKALEHSPDNAKLKQRLEVYNLYLKRDAEQLELQNAKKKSKINSTPDAQASALSKLSPLQQIAQLQQ